MAGLHGACLADAPAAAGEDVYMVGAGNSAGQAALYFARYARSVTLLVRGTDLGASMSSYLVQRIERTPGLRVLLGTEVAECLGGTTLTGLRLRDRAGDERTVPAQCLYVLIGGRPSTDANGSPSTDLSAFVVSSFDPEYRTMNCSRSQNFGLPTHSTIAVPMLLGSSLSIVAARAAACSWFRTAPTSPSPRASRT